MDGRYTHRKVQTSVRLLPHTFRSHINTNLFKGLEERIKYFIVCLIESKKGNCPLNVLL